MKGQASALARRTFADARVRTLSFTLLFAGVAAANVAGYRKAYPTLADRLQLARSFGANKALRLFYGMPYRIDTVGGYASWRVGGTLALFAAFLGAFAAVRALRAEEESGRAELAAAGAISRAGVFFSRIVAVGLTLVVVWVGLLTGLVAGGLAGAGSVYLALATVMVAGVYVGVGTITSQLMPTRRGALELAGAVLAVDLLIRVTADTADLPWLHWLTPLGWAEEIRPYANPRPVVLLVPLAATAALLMIARALDRRRDVGAAIFAPRDTAEPQLALLGSPSLLEFRLERVSVAVWTGATGGLALVTGSLSKTVASAFPPNLRAQLAKIGELRIATPSGYIGLTMLFFVLAVALFVCSRLGALRVEEADCRLETLFALPESRIRWLCGRLALAAAGATAIALAAGLGSASGATVSGASVSFPRLVEAGLNCLPAGALFLGLGTLLISVAPRVGVSVTYGLVCTAFVWELFGAPLGAPAWLLGVSPFDHVGLVPAQPFRAAATLAMVGIGLGCASAAALVFRRRDLAGA